MAIPDGIVTRGIIMRNPMMMPKIPKILKVFPTKKTSIR
jgi:hypothetical protein